MNTALPGATVLLVLRVVDDDTPGNNPVTGLSCCVAIRRTLDDKWFNFLTGAWDTRANYAALVAGNKQTLTDKGDGSYAYAWNQATADGSAERVYEMTYTVTAGAGYVGRQAGEEWRFTREAPSAVWEEAQAQHTGAGTMGAQMGLLDRALGLLGENQFIDQVVADDQGRMTAGRLRLYSVAASVGTDSDVLATYAIEATYSGDATYAATYKMVRS
jgi:hypothetical protein